MRGSEGFALAQAALCLYTFGPAISGYSEFFEPWPFIQARQPPMDGSDSVGEQNVTASPMSAPRRAIEDLTTGTPITKTQQATAVRYRCGLGGLSREVYRNVGHRRNRCELASMITRYDGQYLTVETATDKAFTKSLLDLEVA